jgi:hypothetical protein
VSPAHPDHRDPGRWEQHSCGCDVHLLLPCTRPGCRAPVRARRGRRTRPLRATTIRHTRHRNRYQLSPAVGPAPSRRTIGAIYGFVAQETHHGTGGTSRGAAIVALTSMCAIAARRRPPLRGRSRPAPGRRRTRAPCRPLRPGSRPRAACRMPRPAPAAQGADTAARAATWLAVLAPRPPPAAAMGSARARANQHPSGRAHGLSVTQSVARRPPVVSGTIGPGALPRPAARSRRS